MQRMRFAWLLALGLATCGSDSVTPNQACADLAAAFCGRIDACANLILRIAYGDTATCRARGALVCPQVFKAPGTTTTPDRLEACSKAVAALSCADVYTRQIPQACRAKPGPQADGTTCGDDGQCASGFCRKSGLACGTCGPRAQAGATCTVDDDCDAGLACAANRQCVAFGSAGATCDANRPCAAPLVCDAGRCVTPGDAGASCTPSPSGGNCDHTQGLYCPAGGTCRLVVYASAGQACGVQSSGDLALCTAGATCSSTPSGTCVAPAVDGAACNPANNVKCLSPASCDNGLCKLPDPASCH